MTSVTIDMHDAQKRVDEIRGAMPPRHAFTSDTSEHHTVSATLQRAAGVHVVRRPFWPHLLLVLGLTLVAGAALVAAVISIMKAVS